MGTAPILLAWGDDLLIVEPIFSGNLISIHPDLRKFYGVVDGQSLVPSCDSPFSNGEIESSVELDSEPDVVPDIQVNPAPSS
jgi:hypothetical protein